MISSKTIEPNVSKKIEPNTSKKIEHTASNKIEQIASKQKETAINQTIFNHHLKYYIDNLSIPLLTTLLGINTAKKISISETDKSADTNCTGMEYISLPAVSIGPKYLTRVSEQLVNKIIA